MYSLNNKQRDEKKYKVIVVKVPKNDVKRVRWVNNRVLQVDFRGIRVSTRTNDPPALKTKWASAQELQAQVDAYFESCYGPLFDKNRQILRDKNGQIIYGQIHPFTVSGLAYYLGVSTVSLRKYATGNYDELGFDEKLSPQYSIIIKRAKQRIEAYAETRLYDRDGQQGSKFVLDTAFGWVTNREQAEIIERRVNAEVKKRELELKEKLLGEKDVDKNIQIQIVRKGEQDD